MTQLVVYVHGDLTVPIVRDAARLILYHGCVITYDLDKADVAIAPLLQTKLPMDEVNTPKHGTLIFHPSLLPRHKGRDAIKWAYKMGEEYTGATWFWADDGLDTGDICEQEVLSIHPAMRPREFYERTVIPSALRMLGYIIRDLQVEHVRRRPQQSEHGTYEPPL